MKWTIIHIGKLSKKALIPSLIGILLLGCYPSEELNNPEFDTDVELRAELDLYIQQHFTDEYGVAVRYKYVDRYVSPFERVAPPRTEVVRPMLDFIDYYWIAPYLEVKNGEQFFREHVPAEIIFLGGFIYNNNGTVTLGTADAGVRITFTNVNAVDPDDIDWRTLQLNTVYHEFAHIVHQRYKLPSAFETISASGYTSAGSWFTLTDEEAWARGFVSPYSTSSPNEDFAEIVAFYLFDSDFENKFIVQNADCITPECLELNAGKTKIQQKLSAIAEHYLKVTGVDLHELRAAVQARL